MTNKELIQQIREGVRVTAQQGQASVNVVDLDRYLDQWEKALPLDEGPLSQFQLDKLRAQFEEYLANQQRIHEGRMEMYRAVNIAGRRAIKSTLLINGGAAAALLAFIGHISTAATSLAHVRAAIPELASPLALYVTGLLLTAMSAGAVYVAAARYFAQKTKAGDVFNSISVALVIVSYVLFAWGSWIAYNVFRSL
jgi:hypothetical protein